MIDKKRKIVFMGTSEFAVPVLTSLNKCYEVVLVVASPDKPAGRRQAITPPPVKLAAQELGLQIEQPAKLRDNEEFLDTLNSVKPELIVVVVYGKILPPEIINLSEHGCINIHGSLLPKYRGPSPLQTAIMNGDQETGISFILMDLGMDTGDIIDHYSVKIEPEDSFVSLGSRLSKLAAKKVCQVVEGYIDGDLNLEIQNDDEASYCYKMTESMGRVQWSLSARAIANRIRAIGDQIGVYAFWGDKRLRLIEAEVNLGRWQTDNDNVAIGTVFKGVDDETKQIKVCIKCGKGCLRLKKVQLEGKQPMDIKDFVNGQQGFVDSQLS